MSLRKARTWFQIGAWTSGIILALPVIEVTIEFLMIGFLPEALFTFMIGGIIAVCGAMLFGAITYGFAALCGASTDSTTAVIDVGPRASDTTTVYVNGGAPTYLAPTYVAPPPVVYSGGYGVVDARVGRGHYRSRSSCFNDGHQVGRGGGIIGSSVPVIPQDLGGSGQPHQPAFSAGHNGHQVGRGGGIIGSSVPVLPQDLGGSGRPGNRL